MEQRINYIKAHKTIQLLTKNDIELRPIHKSLLDAIFMYWNTKDWVELFNIDRESLMEYSKISNRKTYYEALSFLQDRGYIIYKPSKNPDIASVFGMGKKVTSTITCDGSSAGSSDGSSGGTIYINLKTIKPKTIKLINDNVEIIEQCLEGWIENYKPVELDDFELAWSAYGRKGNKLNSKKKWAKITQKDFEDIMAHIPTYINSVSEKKYLKDFERYLSSEHWKSNITGVIQLFQNQSKEKWVKVTNGNTTQDLKLAHYEENLRSGYFIEGTFKIIDEYYK